MDITAKRGYKEDYDRGSELVVHDIRQGKLGRYTLDRCEEMEQKVMTESIQSIKERLKSIQRIDDPTLESLRNDPRKGVQQALASFERRLKKEALIKEKYEEMFCFEKQGYAQGHQWIAGIDEVGRGPLAGPVVAAAVILPKNEIILGLNDSKQLSEKSENFFINKFKKKPWQSGSGSLISRQSMM